jgi:hypothetical protein
MLENTLPFKLLYINWFYLYFIIEVDFTLALAFRPANRLFERGLAGRVAQIDKKKNPDHLQGVNETDKNVVRCNKWKLMISATTLPNLKKM